MTHQKLTLVWAGGGGPEDEELQHFILICSLHVLWYILKQSRKSNFAPAQKLKKHKSRVDQNTFRYGDTVLIILT